MSNKNINVNFVFAWLSRVPQSERPLILKIVHKVINDNFDENEDRIEIKHNNESMFLAFYEDRDSWTCCSFSYGGVTYGGSCMSPGKVVNFFKSYDVSLTQKQQLSLF